jgi:adenylylsulfate kinase
MEVPTLFLTGTCAAGKSAIAFEVHDVLREAEVAHAVVDLDALTWQWPSSTPFNRDLKFENLAAMWPHHRAHGASRLILAGVLQDRDELARYEQAARRPLAAASREVNLEP